MKHVKDNHQNFSTLWLDIEDTASHAYWGNNVANNRAFMHDLLAAATRELGHSRVGVYASYYMWGLVFGSHSYDCCSSHKLWFADYDGKDNFDGFMSFGGWRHPSMKQYHGTTNLCGMSVDLSYVP